MSGISTFIVQDERTQKATRDRTLRKDTKRHRIVRLLSEGYRLDCLMRTVTGTRAYTQRLPTLNEILT